MGGWGGGKMGEEERDEEMVSGTGCKVWYVFGLGCGRGLRGGVTWVWKMWRWWQCARGRKWIASLVYNEPLWIS